MNASPNPAAGPPRHPSPAKPPVPTSNDLFDEAVRTAEQSGVLAKCERRLMHHPGAKSEMPVVALLVVMLIELVQTGSYERAELASRIAGLTAAQQRRVKLPGLRTRTVSYDIVCTQVARLERALDEGWTAPDGTRCGWEWFTMAMLAGSRMTQDADGNWVDPATGVTAVGIDDTAFPTWARKLGPNPSDEDIAAGITSCGADPDARNGHRTPTNSQPSEFVYGYQVTVVVAVAEVRWCGNPRKIAMGDYQPPWIIDVIVSPANHNPGTVGREAIVRALAICAITDLVADRGFSMKSVNFVQGMHELGINVVMDHPGTETEVADFHVMGRSRDPVIEHVGTFLHAWMPPQWEVPPADLSDNQLRDWYARRLIYAYTAHQHLGGGDVQIKNPYAAGRLTTQSNEATANGAMLHKQPKHAPAVTQDYLTVPVEMRNLCQREPYGTPAWWYSYLRRLVVESANAMLKRGVGLTNKCCKAMGIAAHTMAAVMLAAAYNMRLRMRLEYQARQQQALDGTTDGADHTTLADQPVDTDDQNPGQEHSEPETSGHDPP